MKILFVNAMGYGNIGDDTYPIIFKRYFEFDHDLYFMNSDVKPIPKDLDLIVFGGGGLISGIAIIAKSINPNIRIIGVEAELWPTMTDMVAGADIRGGGETLAEGIAVKKPGDLTMPVVRQLVDEILLVSEVMIEQAVGVLVDVLVAV